MNIVRKLLSSSSAGSSTDIPNAEGGADTADHMGDHLTRQETTIKTPEQELLGLRDQSFTSLMTNLRQDIN